MLWVLDLQLVEYLAVDRVCLGDETALVFVRAVSACPVVTGERLRYLRGDKRFEFSEPFLEFASVVETGESVVEFVLSCDEAVAVLDAL